MPDVNDIKISYRIELDPKLDPETMDMARRQGEDLDLLEEKLQEFRDKIYEKGECNPHRMDDEFLIKFLRARAWKVEYAYRLMCRYYDFRSANSKLYLNVRPIHLRSLGDLDLVNVPPYRDQHGRRMLVIKIANWRPHIMPIEDLFRAAYLILELGSIEPRTQVHGAVGVFDVKGLKMNHLWHVTPSVAQKVVQLLVTHMPIKVQAAHIINNGWVFDTAYQLFKPFISDKMREKIFVHGTDLESLHKYIDPARLPACYGGQQKDYPYKKWLEKMKYDEKVLKNLEEIGYVIEPEDLASISDVDSDLSDTDTASQSSQG